MALKAITVILYETPGNRSDTTILVSDVKFNINSGSLSTKLSSSYVNLTKYP